MKTLLKCSVCFLIISCAGSYSKFIKTGTPFNFLPEDREIKILPEGDLTKYEEVGIAEVKNPDKEIRVTEAKRLAKENGGESIMPVSKDSNDDKQNFRVLVQVKEDEEIKEAEAEELPEEEPVKEQPKPVVKEKPDYSNLPFVPYRILAEECVNLKGEKFRAAFYPKKIMDVPNGLLSQTGKNKKLVELDSKKGLNKIYLIVPVKGTKVFQRMISKKKQLKFVYSPVSLYGTIPVVKFLDVIE
jgi:hypothetical protein